MHLPRILAYLWGIMFLTLVWISLVGYFTGGMFCGYTSRNCGISSTEYLVYGYALLFLVIALFAFKVKSSNVPRITIAILLIPAIPFLHLVYIAFWFLSH